MHEFNVRLPLISPSGRLARLALASGRQRQLDRRARFPTTPPLITAFARLPQQCLKYDQRMYLCDVRGSIAYSKALLKVGIVSEHEQLEIERGLGEVAKEWEEKRVRSPDRRVLARRFRA